MSAKISFQDISFEEKDEYVKVNFLRIFSTKIMKKDLRELGDFKIDKNSIEFKGISEKKAGKKFNFLLRDSFDDLKNNITKKKTIYVHRNSGIPLIGHNAFGLIDRNTSIIEVRCITGCNLDCVYCSVDQNKRPVDFVVEKNYLVQEFKGLVEYKGIKDIEAHIGTQGEPLLYEPLPRLIEDLSSLDRVSVVALDTNGTFLTKEKVDELVDAGLTRFCFSINALDEKKARKIAGKNYNLKHILKMIGYISKKDVELIITPVWIPEINDKEIGKLVDFSKDIDCKIGIQNFLNYKFGKNPVQEMSWDEFIERMEKLEKEKGTKLLFDFKKDFNVRKTKPLPKPFRKGDIIRANVVCDGRLKNEKLAVAKNRVISVYDEGKKFKIVREKHNIFSAKAI